MFESVVLRNTVWLLADKVVRTGGGVALTIYTARKLSVDGFGQLMLAQAWVAPFGALASLGLVTILVPELTRRVGEERKITAAAFWLRVWSALFSFAVVLFASGVAMQQEHTTRLVLLIIAGTMVFQSWDVVELRLHAAGDFASGVIRRNAAFLIQAVLRLFVLSLHPTVLFVAVCILMETIFSAALLGRIHKSKFGSLKISGTKLEQRQLIGRCVPLILAGVATAIYTRVDHVVVGMIRGVEDVGVLSAAVRLTEVLFVVPTVLVAATAPKLAKCFARSPKDFGGRIVQLMRTTFYLNVLCAALLSFFSQNIVEVLYGIDYTDTAGVLRIYVWSAPFVALGVAATAWFANNRKLWISLIQTIIGAVVSLTVTGLFAGEYGALAAAWAAVAATCLAVIVPAVVIPAARPVFFLQLRAVGFIKIIPPNAPA